MTDENNVPKETNGAIEETRKKSRERRNYKKEGEKVKRPRKNKNAQNSQQSIFKKSNLKIIPLGGLHEIGKNITVFEYEDETCRISMSKNRPCANIPMPPPPPAPAPIAAPISAAPAPAQISAGNSAPASEEDYSKNPGSVKSPMVGVVYLSSDPNSPNYVKVGDTVSEGDTVCLIEAMKTYNPVKAHKGGRVSKILVESGDPVEYGEPLIVIE